MRTKFVFPELRERILCIKFVFPDLRKGILCARFLFPELRGRVGDLGLQSVNRWQEIFRTKFVFVRVARDYQL